MDLSKKIICYWGLWTVQCKKLLLSDRPGLYGKRQIRFKRADVCNPKHERKQLCYQDEWLPLVKDIPHKEMRFFPKIRFHSTTVVIIRRKGIVPMTVFGPIPFVYQYGLLEMLTTYPIRNRYHRTLVNNFTSSDLLGGNRGRRLPLVCGFMRYGIENRKNEDVHGLWLGVVI